MNEIADLARAAYKHGRIISNRRLRELNALQEPTAVDVPSALAQIAGLQCGRIDGEIMTARKGDGTPQTTRSYQLLRRLCGMIATYIKNRLAFLLDKVQELGQKAFEVYTHLEDQVEDCLRVLPELVKCDQRWRCVLPQHREDIHDVLVRASAKGLLNTGSPELVHRVQAWIH